ncbi:carbohydrate ABC transporter permease [Angustibacter sp. McL0619]|uniref:carbohydrate ABC transporter permease n=1 Tax=Angustibacter sp. McL0619 TaxID=3415676 RepID=UPI003CF79657
MSGSTIVARIKRRSPLPYLLLAPTFVLLVVLTGYPLVRLLVMSTQKFGRAQVFGAPPEFVGLQNYRTVLTDPQFWAVLGRSAIFCVVNVAVTMVLGMLVALLLTKLGKVMRLTVTLGLLLAWAMPALTAIVIWGWMFDTQYGVLNWLLSAAGMNMLGHSWLIQPISFFFVATVVITWQSIPFVAFTLYAGLTQVPEELLEASGLDGASAFQRFRLITYPLLRPVVLLLTMLSVIWDLRVFTQIFALQDAGGITAKTSTIGVYIYQVGVAQGRFDTGSAIAVILVVIMLAVSFVYVRQVIQEDVS